MTEKPKTQLEKEKAAKAEVAENLEYFKQVENPESEGGGRKFVEDYEMEKIRKEQAAKDAAASYLQAQQQKRIGYMRGLADYAMRVLADNQLGEGYEFSVVPTFGSPINVYGKSFATKEGLVWILRGKKGVYVRAVGITFEAEIDIKVCHVMAVQMENTIDSEKGILLSDNRDTLSTMKKTGGGIYLP